MLVALAVLPFPTRAQDHISLALFITSPYNTLIRQIQNGTTLPVIHHKTKWRRPIMPAKTEQVLLPQTCNNQRQPQSSTCRPPPTPILVRESFSDFSSCQSSLKSIFHTIQTLSRTFIVTNVFKMYLPGY